MSDELDIRSGGVVAVDPESLRAAADRCERIGGELAGIEDLVRSVVVLLADIAPVAYDSGYTAHALAGRVDAASSAARSFGAQLRFAAAVYEIVELRAAAAFEHSAGGPLARLRESEISERLAALSDAYPWAATTATIRETGWRLAWPAQLAVQGMGAWPLHAFSGAPFVPGATFVLGLGIAATGAGTLPATARLSPGLGHARVTALAPPTAGTAPATLAEAAGRIPGGQSAARVRVERYTMTDGSKQFAVYVSGTRAIGPDARDPFDMNSNLELYTGHGSASYEATVAALREAGAQPGDVVHAFGHSQGAMITAHLALEGEYDTRTLVSFGSPVEADVGDRTLSVSLRHSDDPVAFLEGGGHAQGVGAPGSFVAERVADPALGAHDVTLPAHGIAGYTETARMLDESADPRMAQVRELFDELGDAASVDVVEYSARTLSPSGGGGG
ncbi:hypothetical protein [Microbacterium rhizomatis]|uniref:hypothetical protein n=1 Tax=Microbacterium rhizomatis TaxID=1631477 RepID=UPI001478670F|nr:hypothetical protein [Microbacterium rhizomatis]